MTTRVYTLPVEQTRWHVEGGAQTVFTWEYDEGRDRLLNLYEKGKTKQWNSRDRIDWETPVDHDNPFETLDAYVPIYGSEVWEEMGTSDRATLKHHLAAWQFSQFLHGEQGALICASKIVQTVPDIDSKYYAATQVVDEARHVETYSRFLHEKLDLAYPINPHLKSLLDNVVSDTRWDMTYLGMQVLIEGLALAAFGLIRDVAENPLARAVTAYVMEDEARHVAFGRLALRDFYPQLTERERDEREEFCVEACYLMRDRFLAEEVWSNLGLPLAGVPAVRQHIRGATAVPQPAVHAHRAHPEGHRALRQPGALGVRGHGRARVQRRRPRCADQRRRADGGRDRRRPSPAGRRHHRPRRRLSSLRGAQPRPARSAATTLGGSGRPATSSGTSTGCANLRSMGSTPDHTLCSEVGRRVDRPGVADLRGGPVDRQRDDLGGAQLGRLGRAHLRPATREDVLDDDPQRGELLVGLADRAGGAEHHGGAVVHRVVERRPRADDGVDRGDGDADRDPRGEPTEHPAQRRAMDQQPVAVAGMDGGNGVRPAVDDEGDVADPLGVEDGVDRVDVVGPALGVPSVGEGGRRRHGGSWCAGTLRFSPTRCRDGRLGERR